MSPRRSQFFAPPVVRSIVGLLFVLFALTAFGQSGRRQSKSPAVSVPTPEAKQPEKKPDAGDELKVNLMVGTNRGDVFAGIPFNISDGVLQSCAGRLKESNGVRVDVVTKEMTRSDAINRAKAAKDGYVVWLNLRGEDQMASSANNLNGVFIEYLVLEAITAKVKTQGNCYQGYNKGGVILGPSTGRSNNVIVEDRLRVAAQEAATRVLKALHIASRSDIPSQ